MLLRDVILFIHIPLQRRENGALIQQILPALALKIQHGIVCDALIVRLLLPIFGRNCKVLELLAQDDNGLFCEERVLALRGEVGGGGCGEREGVDEVLLQCEEPWLAGCAVEGVGSVAEEGEYKAEAFGVELVRR
jgi:hypothetical protein